MVEYSLFGRIIDHLSTLRSISNFPFLEMVGVSVIGVVETTLRINDFSLFFVPYFRLAGMIDDFTF